MTAPAARRPAFLWAAALAAAAFVLCGAALAPTTARAGADLDKAWIVAQVSGAAYVAPAEAPAMVWHPLSGGEILDAGQVVGTGPDGAVVLTHGNDVLRLAGNTIVSLRAIAGSDGVTRLGQSIGRILLDVETRPGWKFHVETPYLTAVVKGTSFAVSVEPGAAEVDVARGVVGVSSRDGRHAVDLGAGESGRVSRDAPSRVAVGAVSGVVGRGVAPGPSPAAADPSRGLFGIDKAQGVGKAKGQDKGQGKDKGQGQGHGQGGGQGQGKGSGGGSSDGGHGNGGGHGKGGGKGKGSGKGGGHGDGGAHGKGRN